MQRAHGNIYFEYQLSTADIRNEELFNIYAYKYPDQVRKKLMTFCRVKLSKVKDITKEHRKKISLASRKHYYHILSDWWGLLYPFKGLIGEGQLRL